MKRMGDQRRLKLVLLSVIIILGAANAYMFYMRWNIGNGTAIFLPPAGRISSQSVSPPNAPANFQIPWQSAASVTERVELDWTKSAVSGNNAPEGYYVYRTPASMNVPCANGTLYATVGNVSGYTDHEVNWRTTMNYSVQAFNAAGVSACTHIVTGAPAQCPGHYGENTDGTCSLAARNHVAGQIWGPPSSNWVEVRDALVGTAVTVNEGHPEVRVGSSNSQYTIQRSFFTFQTGGMPDESIIQSAVLSTNIWNASTNIPDDSKLIYLLEVQDSDPMNLIGSDYSACGDSVGEMASPPVSLLTLDALPAQTDFDFPISPAHYSYIERVLPGTEYCFLEEHDFYNTPFPTPSGANYMGIRRPSNASEPKLLITYTPAGFSTPHYPRGMAANANIPGQITLTWEPAENADGYYIFRIPGSCNANSYTIIGHDTTSFTDMSVVSGTTYQYQIKSYYEGNQRFSGQSLCDGGGYASPWVYAQAN